ncbi:FAD-binding protein, partial [Nocardioides sp. DS6]
MTPEPAGATWAGSHTFGACGLVRPASVGELQELVASQPRVRALGSRHSFTDLADTAGLLVSVDGLDGDPGQPALDGSVVRVPAGMRYGDLAVWLQARGRALANLASLPHISVAGAIATGTHGSGVGNGSLAAAVTALELVDGRGELVRLTAGPGGSPDFAGAVVGLGALGIVTHLELQTEPSYDVVQVVHEGLTWPTLAERVEEILAVAYSVSVFTRWVDEPDGTVGRAWVKSRSGSPAVPGATPADGPRHVIPGLDPSLTTQQLGRPGPWHERLPHFRGGGG